MTKNCVVVLVILSKLTVDFSERLKLVRIWKIKMQDSFYQRELIMIVVFCFPLLCFLLLFVVRNVHLKSRNVSRSLFLKWKFYKILNFFEVWFWLSFQSITAHVDMLNKLSMEWSWAISGWPVSTKHLRKGPRNPVLKPVLNQSLSNRFWIIIKYLIVIVVN